MLRILSATCVILIAISGFLYLSNSDKEATIAELEKTNQLQKSELEFRKTLAQLSVDINATLKDYRDVSKQHQEELQAQQQFLITLSQQVRDDVSDYSKDPITASFVTDINWVYAYNRSTLRIPEVK